LAPIALKAFLRLEAMALSGLGLFFGVSCAGRHGALLPTVVLAVHSWQASMSPKKLDFNYFHGPLTVCLRRWYS
jgi:hypothetical protein